MERITNQNMLIKCISCIGIMLLTASISRAQENVELVTAESILIKSIILEEVREISVFLPDEYEKTSHQYPILYLLDGRTHFQHAISAASFLSNQRTIPEIIIVSIHNVDRNRDFSPVYDGRNPVSGGAEKFLDFISEELVPYMEENYRVSGFSILMGHSLGGTFLTYSLLTRPEVFNACISISPHLQFADNYLIKESGKLLKSKYQHHKYFYMTVGSEPDYYAPLNEFARLIREKSSNAIDFEYLKMETETHATIPYPSTFNGLKYIFSDYQLPEEKYQESLSEIDRYYKKISLKYSYEINAPENVINLLGYTYLRKADFVNAILVFKENVKRHPNSPNVYDSLAEAFENNNQLKKAEINYQKAYDMGIVQNDANTSIFKNNLDRVQKE